MQPFKIQVRRQGGWIELIVTLVYSDEDKEQFRCKNFQYDFMMVCYRPRIRNKYRLKQRRINWFPIEGKPKDYLMIVNDAGNEILKVIDK